VQLAVHGRERNEDGGDGLVSGSEDVTLACRQRPGERSEELLDHHGEP